LKIFVVVLGHCWHGISMLTKTPNIGDWVLLKSQGSRIQMPIKVEEVNEQTGFIVGSDQHGNGDRYQVEMTSRHVTDLPSDPAEAKTIHAKFQKYANKYCRY
jgi:hypothetical protein